MDHAPSGPVAGTAVAGYSGTPLAAKLGVREGMAVRFVGAPATVLAALPASVVHRRRPEPGTDVAAVFVTERADLEKELPVLAKSVFPAGAIWVAWPKKASGVATEVDENTVREVALPMGLVDNKVCAIDQTWSALRVVWRKELRSPQ